MRLPMLDDGPFKLSSRVKMFMIRLLTRRPVPDVVKLHFYRYGSVGKLMGAGFQSAMKGPSDWTHGERELMAAFVSRKNACVF